MEHILNEVDKLFENNPEGKISERNYLAMSKKYGVEQIDLEDRIARTQSKLETKQI